MKELLQLLTIVNDRLSTHLGRPWVAIEEDQIWFLVENGFRIDDIATIFGCLDELLSKGYEIFRLYQTLVVPCQIQSWMKSWRVWPHFILKVERRLSVEDFKVKGYVSREKWIRESLCRVDPGGVQLRRDLYALHFVLFLWFRLVWARHKLRTEGYWTPQQL